MSSVRALSLRSARDGRPVVFVGLTEHMGDIVASEPVARHLRQTEPNARVVWVVRAPYVELLQHHPDVDHVLTVQCLSDWVQIRPRLRGRVVDLHVVGRSCPVCGVPVCKSGAGSEVTVFTYYDFGAILPAFCRGAGLPPLTDPPRLYGLAWARPVVDRLKLPPRYGVVHCTSNDPTRDWDPPKWDTFIRRLRDESDLPLLEVGACATQPAAQPTEGRSLCGRLSILETAEVIRRAAVYIGIDSGPAHLANAVGTPGAILLGRHRTFRSYLPYTGAYEVGLAELVRTDGTVADIPVHAVYEAAQRSLLRSRRSSDQCSYEAAVWA